MKKVCFVGVGNVVNYALTFLLLGLADRKCEVVLVGTSFRAYGACVFALRLLHFLSFIVCVERVFGIAVFEHFEGG